MDNEEYYKEIVMWQKKIIKDYQKEIDKYKLKIKRMEMLING